MEFKNRTKPNIYQIVDVNDEGTQTSVSKKVELKRVVQDGEEGTPLNAENLNIFNEKIDKLDKAVTTLEKTKDNKICENTYCSGQAFNTYVQQNIWYTMPPSFKFEERKEYVFALRIGQGKYFTTLTGIYLPDLVGTNESCTGAGCGGEYVIFKNQDNVGMFYIVSEIGDIHLKVYER